MFSNVFWACFRVGRVFCLGDGCSFVFGGFLSGFVLRINFRIFFLSDGVPVFSDITVFSGVQVCPGDIVSFGFILNCPASGSASSRSISVVGKQSKFPRRRTDGPVVVSKINQINAQLFLEKCYKFGICDPPLIYKF